MSVPRELEPLIKCYGFPDHLNDEVTLFTEELTVGGISISLAGIAASDFSGFEITASAGAVGSLDQVIRRAFFELIERSSIQRALTLEQFRRMNRFGATTGVLTQDAVFPKSPEPEQWQYSKSNGAALGANLDAACLAARFELLERNAILRSWKGESRPQQLPTPHFIQAQFPNTSLQFRFYEYEMPRGSRASTVGAFIQSDTPGTAHAYGFACRSTLEEAQTSAFTEAIQRIGFLWGEELPELAPSSAATPDFHQDYYLSPLGRTHLQSWLNDSTVRNFSAQKTLEVEYAEIPVAPGVRGLYLARAMSKGALPLKFGESDLFRGTQRVPHPIA